MADMTRGERTVQLFAQMISNPTKKYTIANLMESLNIPDTERRNVQRDMRFLSEMDAGRYIQQESIGRTYDHRKIEVEYITEMSGQEPKLENIEIEFDSHVRLFLEENPFNRSMRIYNGKTGKILAKLKAENNRLLFNWVVSFANAAKVMKPAALQDKLNEYADFLKEVYGKN